MHSITTSGSGHGVCHRSGVVAGTEIAHELGLHALGHLVQHVDVEPALDSDQGGQQPDGTRRR